MLNELRALVDGVSHAQSLNEALGLIVAGVSELMATSVCSVYLVEDEALVLRANAGFRPEAVGCVRLGLSEGLVGLAATRAVPVNIEQASSHPHFCPVPTLGEEEYEAFLGVPIVHQRRVLGVLVVQEKAGRCFGTGEEAALVTLSATLAGAIAAAEASGLLREQARAGRPRIVQGLPGAPGLVLGRAHWRRPPLDLDAVPDRPCEDPARELGLFRAALAATGRELSLLATRLTDELVGDELSLFDAYQAILADAGLSADVETLIRAGLWAPAAWRTVIEAHAHGVQGAGDPYLRERAADLRDLGRRVLARLSGLREPPTDWPERTILVAEELSAAMLAEVPRDCLAGILSLTGSTYSHAAILARALGVPAIMGLSGLPAEALHGRELALDGDSGRVHLEPDGALRAEFERLAQARAQLADRDRGLRWLPAETRDGVGLRLLLNAGLSPDLERGQDCGAQGVGLYRTEIPFMLHDGFPSEAEQVALYRRVLAAFPGQPVVMRLLDIGADKPLPYFPIREDNPALGWRGIRLSLDHPELFLIQARALIRANAGHGNLQILIPMLSTVDELDAALLLLAQARAEVLAEGGELMPMPLVGAMIEVPAAALRAGRFLERVDFISVGSNDLTQYLLAVDRNNPRVARLYDSLHPAVLGLIQTVAEAALRAGKPAHVCGELAGDPLGAVLLLAMGFEGLSMNAANIPRVKAAIRGVSLAAARDCLAAALACNEAEQVRALLEARLGIINSY
ncbi:MAG: phosphoenolpyruvate--protein phosphotransferase [Gammaproteobacteria bacterium]|nr:phosphoenolpyruvate--protein phosphotransferase [Gammaproteobacteria bacterium]